MRLWQTCAVKSKNSHFAAMPMASMEFKRVFRDVAVQINECHYPVLQDYDVHEVRMGVGVQVGDGFE